MKRVAVIMAGGSGERFWPKSRRDRPKQLLDLLSAGKSMIEQSIERISQIIPHGHIFIITSERLLEPMRQALPQIPDANIVAEPCKRNTAPALALAAAFVAARYSAQGFSSDKISMAVLTADQDIRPIGGFKKTVDNALDYVENNEVLGTIGIPPARPETGYGYIEVAEPFSEENGELQIKPVKRFTEKPDSATAEKFFNAGNYLWNSGMFFWRLDTFIEKMKKHAPEIGEMIPEMIKKYEVYTNIPLAGANEKIGEIFNNFPNISIDYSLMEKADNVVVARALFAWDDIGAWDALERIWEHDERGNISSGVCSLVETKDSIIVNSEAKGQRLVATLGLEKIVVVVTDDAIMICPKDRVQEVKKIVEDIDNHYGDKWL
ncbi:MAG: mannose-1-phosphate guanylyltransferase [Candidatus Kapaibacterium sp.]